MTRMKAIQVWFGMVAFAIAAGVAFGVAMTISTGVMLFALSFVPPAMVLFLWPSIQPISAADVLHASDGRS